MTTRMDALHVGILGPVATADVAHLLDGRAAWMPRGYPGAPLLATLIEQLLARGHHVSAYTLSNDMALDEPAWTAHGPRFELHCCPMRVRAWPFNGRHPGRIVDLYALERAGLARAVLAAPPDVVHAHWSYEFAWAALRCGVPHVITCHDSPFLVARMQRGFRRTAYRWLRAGMARHVLGRARRVTTVSPYMLTQVQQLCRVPVTVVPNPIAAAARLRSPRAGRRRLMMVSNGWDARKNGEVGLQAFALLAERFERIELRAFGQDFGVGEAAQLWWRSRGCKGDVRFCGSVARHRLQEELAATDLFIHPAIEESFGAVLAEAMAAGVPVVAGASSGAVPWVVGDAGRLVDVRSPHAIADASQHLLLDPQASLRLGDMGRRRVRDMFGPSSVVDAYEREYRAAMSEQLSAARR